MKGRRKGKSRQSQTHSHSAVFAGRVELVAGLELRVDPTVSAHDEKSEEYGGEQ